MKNKDILFRVLVFGLVLLIFLIHKNSIELENTNLLLVLIVLVFVIGFGILAWQGLKLWKKTDEEILAEYTPAATMLNNGTGTKVLGGGAIVMVMFLSNAWGTHAFVTACVFCGVAFLIMAAPAVYSWYVSRLPKEERPQITGEQICALLIGLVFGGFMSFLMGMCIYHGVWWFLIVPYICFSLFFTRGPVAAIRTFVKSRKKEQDPWEKPDIQR